MPTNDPIKSAVTAKAARERNREPRRVLIAVSQFRPGGAERLVAHLAFGLQGRGHPVTLIVLEETGPWAEELRTQGVAVIGLGSRNARDLVALMRLRKVLKTKTPDVINVHDRWSLPYVRAARWRAGGTPVVFSAHGLMYGEPERAGLKFRWAMRGVSAMTAVSEEVCDRHARFFGWDGRVDIIPNAVPDGRPPEVTRQAVCRELGLPADTFVFLAVGNARPEKAFENLVDAAARLPRTPGARPFTVLIAGALAESLYCRDLVARHEASGLGNAVRFLGYRDDVPALLLAADAFVLSSRSEGLPMVVLEAMMAGLPVVATRVGGVPDAVGDCGLLVEPERPEALAEAMQRLMDDPLLAADLGRRARERARREYSLDRMVDRYLEVYERVVAEHARRKDR